MKTKLIVSTDGDSFEERVNKLLEDGWEVIPETLKAEISATADRSVRTFAVVLKHE